MASYADKLKKSNKELCEEEIKLPEDIRIEIDNFKRINFVFNNLPSGTTREKVIKELIAIYDTDIKNTVSTVGNVSAKRLDCDVQFNNRKARSRIFTEGITLCGNCYGPFVSQKPRPVNTSYMPAMPG